MSNVYSVFVLIAALFTASFGVILVFHSFRQKREATRAAAALVLSAALWSVGVGLFFDATTISAAELWVRWTHFMGICLAVSFYFFSYVFHVGLLPPNRIQKITALVIFCLALPYFGTNLLISSVDINLAHSVLARSWNYGPLVLAHILVTVIYIGFGCRELIVRAREKENRERDPKYVAWITWSSLFGVGALLAATLIARIFGNFEFYWLAPIFFVPWIAVLSFAVVQYHIISARVFFAQTMTLALSVTLLINIFTSGGIFGSIGRLVIAAVFMAVGILLVRELSENDRRQAELLRLNKELQWTTDTLRNANKKLEEISEQKTLFVSVASHELKRPLTAITGYSSLLAEGSFGKMPKKAINASHIIYSVGKTLVSTLEEFLDLNRFELGKVQYSKKKLDMVELVKKVEMETRVVMGDDSKTKLSFEYPESKKPMFVNADEERIKHVVANLVHNGIKYSPRGEVNVRVRGMKTFVRIEVKDTGIGISRDELPKLFQRFYRTQSAKTLDTHGSGLGLYLAREIVNDHDGSLLAESDGLGKGSTFILELPIVRS